MTETEKEIIHRAVNTALSFGAGVLTTSMNELTDNGFEWTDAHERYALEYSAKELGMISKK